VPGQVKKETPSSYETILKGYYTITLKEFAVFFDKTMEEAGAILQELERQNKVRRTETKAGPLWKVI